MSMVIGLLHPGNMGSSIGAAAKASGARVIYCPVGRSDATRARAVADGLEPVASLDSLVEQSDVILSVCPPAAAGDVASEVLARGFGGLYVDGNAISPTTARAIGQRITDGGGSYVDGGIVGPPARHAGFTVLYLSGQRAAEIAAIFEGSPLETSTLGCDPGAASALKMAFAAWTKGSAALLLAVRALAKAEGVEDGLAHAWDRLAPDLPLRVQHTAAGTAPKAWRFVGEMHEIAETFEHANLPGGFHRAAADVYRRLEALKPDDAPRDLTTVLEHLLRDA